MEDVNSVAGLDGVVGWHHDGGHDAVEFVGEADEARFCARRVAFGDGVLDGEALGVGVLVGPGDLYEGCGTAGR